MSYSFKPMTIADIPAVLQVRLSTVENSVSLQELSEVYGVTPEYLAEAMRSDVRGWLCEDDRNVVGFSMGDRSNGEVQVVAVLPSHEDRGIGSTLLSHVCDWLFEEGHEEIWLLANPDPYIRATGFYQKLGWTPTGTMRGDDQVLTLCKR